VRLSDILAGKPRRVVTLPSTATAMEASSLMEREVVGAVMVVDARGHFLGVVTERHLALAIASSGARLFRRPLSEVMRPGGPTASPGDSVGDIIKLVSRLRIRHVPVLEGSALVGVVSSGDLLETRLEEKDRESAVLHDLARARLAS
jgi:CBS domain-containing protein